ncbi:MAG: endo-1,4-beta-xylanase [Verrucomicrobia bacterium]|nr:endo-1,4-beta-xylanase [Verrucomicrobiota bacterium]MCH8526684.1 endo-1,4-beta-xylanase [Kiritimatiellia bacterium]
MTNEPSPNAPNWRLNDGTLTQAPEGQTAGDGHSVLHPGGEGVPVFSAPFSVEAGDVVSIRLEVSTKLTEADEGADGQAGVVLTLLPAESRTNHNPDAEHRQIVIVGSEAESIQVAFRSRNAYEPGALMMVPTLSFFERSLNLRQIEWENHGADADPAGLTVSPVSYAGQEADAPWRDKAREKIERYRKADLEVLILDRWGNPLPGHKVEVEQMRHAYPFGTAVVGSRIADAPREFSPESGMTTEQWLADNERYRREIERNFNTVVFENELKWPQWSRDIGVGIHHQNWTLQALEWLREREFKVKGHTLVWGSWRFTPTWLREQEENPEAIQRAVYAHIRDIADATAERTHYWDVLNEPMSHRNLIDLLGVENVASWFKEAREALPDNRLVMNEFDLVGNGGNANRRANFLAFYEELKAAGAPLDVIGFQGHFWSERFTPPEQIWAIIDEVHEATGLPLMISEFDSNLPNEQMQADYTRDFLKAWFAHPATEAFIMWGFWGGAHWMGDAGSMFRRDWSEKPNLAAYRDLVYGDWWTRETLESGEDGIASLRAFKGRHRLLITPPGGGEPILREITLPSEGRRVHVVMP